MGYRVYLDIAVMLRQVLAPENTQILDAGCGTGLVGLALASQGYTNITGLDYSEAMLDEAAGKGVYESLERADLTAPLALSANHFDAVTCVGTLTLGHVGPEALTELIRVTRPGGYLCFSVRDEAWAEHCYAEVLEAHVAAGRCSEVETRSAPYIEEDGSTCQLCLYEVGD